MDWLASLISERVDHLLDATPDPTVVIDSRSVLRFVNERVEAAFGHSREELVGRPVAELVPGWDLDELRRLCAAGATPTGVVRHRSGDTVPVEVSVVSLDAGGGHSIVFLHDISTRLRLEQENDRARDELIANVSHELRTPLTSIIGYLELLADLGEDELGPQARRLVDIISRNARRELRLVNDLLAVSFMEEDRASMRFEVVDLTEVAAQVVEERQLFARGAGLSIGLDAGGEVAVRGDSDRLARMLENLLVNACKFSAPGGEVRVAVSADGQDAVVTVADNGIGMSEDEQARAFERMYRAPGAIDRHVEGTGLGLAIVKSIVEAHGGTIGVRSAQGRGTTVRVVLPLSDQGVRFVRVGGNG